MILSGWPSLTGFVWSDPVCPRHIPIPGRWIFYSMRSGDTLHALGRHFGESASLLARVNHSVNPTDSLGAHQAGGSFGLYFCPEAAVSDRLSQDKAGRLILAGRVLKAGEEIEVIVGGNWHRALVRKIQGRWDLILDTGRENRRGWVDGPTTRE